MSSPFVKQLVASDRKTRDAALASLTKFIAAARPFSHDELLKLWKALFYCFWHSDRPHVQQALASDLADLVLAVADINVIPFLKAFWETICREWNGIDVLRLDKFYTLVRQFISAAFKRLHRTHWLQDSVTQYTECLEALPLSPSNARVPNGIRYHICDVYLEELTKIVPETDRHDVPMSILMRPFEQLVLRCPTKSVKLRVMKSIYQDARLHTFDYISPMDTSDLDSDEGASSIDGDEEEDEEFAGFD